MFKNILKDTCILFTVLTFILLFGYSLLIPTSAGIVSGLSLETSIILFISSFFLRLFYNILHINTISFLIRVIFHYALSTATVFFATKLIGTATNRYSGDLSTFIILAFFTLFYSAIIAIVMHINKKKHEKNNNSKIYSSIIK